MWTERTFRLALVAVAVVLTAHHAGAQHPAAGAAGGWRVAPKPSVVIGESEDAPLQTLRTAVRLSDGRFVVADGGLSSRVTLFGPTGALLAVLGGTGDGPGEFRYASSLTADANDSIFVYDQSLQRLTVFTGEGRVARTVRSRVPLSLTHGHGLLSVERLKGDVWVARTPEVPRVGRLGDIDQDTTVVGLVDGALTAFRPLATLPGLMSTTRMFKGREAFGGAPFTPLAIVATWGRCVFATTTQAPTIQVYAADGTPVTTIDEPFDTRATTDDDIQTLIEARLKSRPGDDAPAVRRMLEGSARPRELPYIAQMVLDAWGEIWVQQYQPPYGQTGARWHVLSETGDVLAVVDLPARTSVYSITEDGVLGGTLGEFDENLVVLHRFDRRPSDHPRPLPQCGEG